MSMEPLKKVDTALRRAVEMKNRLKEEQMKMRILEAVSAELPKILAPLLAKIVENGRLNAQEIYGALSGVKVHVPEIHVPRSVVNIDVPPIEVPEYDDSKIIAALTRLGESIKDIKIEVPKSDVFVDAPDLSPIVKELGKLTSQKAPKIDSAKIIDAIGELKDAFKKFKVDVPDTFKLDDAQIKALMASQPVIATAPALADMPTQQENAVVSLTTANTQYSYTFPTGTVSFYIKLRSQNVQLLYSWTTGTLPTSGDGSKYISTPQNFIQSRERGAFGGKTIYLQTGSASQVAEIEVYKL